MKVQRATKRTFYIERYGAEYRIVKVWEVGAALNVGGFDAIFRRVLESSPDERIIAEQQIGVSIGPTGVRLSASDQQLAEEAVEATTRILRGERPPESEQP